jgi:ubiquinone biosynthesis protein COQ4
MELAKHLLGGIEQLGARHLGIAPAPWFPFRAVNAEYLAATVHVARIANYLQVDNIVPAACFQIDNIILRLILMVTIAIVALSIRQGEAMTSTTPTDTGEDVSTLSPIERWRRALAALARVIADPERTEDVLVFSTYANAGSIERRIDMLLSTPEGRQMFEQHRTIDSHTVDLDALSRLPVGTLGYAYAQFMRSRGLTPDVFDAPPAEVTDPRASYVIQRLRQTHDLWHVVTGHDTDPAGEVALQAFTFAQLHAPSSLILALVGTVRGLREVPGLPRQVARAFLAGAHAERFAAFPWEDHWTTPLAEVRAMLGVSPAPMRAAA